MSKILIKNTRIIDPVIDKDSTEDIYIEDGKIKVIGKNISIKAEKTIDAKGTITVPGFFDIHVHLREPGREDEETLETGSLSAAKGGFTGICVMANTNPPCDNQAGVKLIISEAARISKIPIYPFAAITKGLKGVELTEIGDLVEAGAIGLSDDGETIMNSRIMRVALEYSKMFNIPVSTHSEDRDLSLNGMMHEGLRSFEMGIMGIPAASEDIMVARDIELAAMTGGHLHIAHLSALRSVELIREAKKRGINVTCEVTPHHLVLTDDDIIDFNPMMKVRPPIRSKEHREALIEGLLDDTIDCIATDHAPHLDTEKRLPFEDAPFGMIGLETAFPLLYTHFVEKGIIPLKTLIKKMSFMPRNIFHIPYNKLEVGNPADITIIDIEREKTYTEDCILSKSKNSPFIGWRLKGFIKLTIVNGKVVYEETSE